MQHAKINAIVATAYNSLASSVGGEPMTAAKASKLSRTEKRRVCLAYQGGDLYTRADALDAAELLA